MDGNDVSTTALLDEETVRELWKAVVSVSERVMSEVSMWRCTIALKPQMSNGYA
jgi:hypothetical protein